MKLSRFAVAVLFVSALASLSLLAQAPGGRGGAPPVVTAMATPEQLAQIPQIADRTLDRTGFPAHKIIGNLYYVGTMECSSFLFVTPAGNILINSNYEETLPLLKTAIESLGFKVEDTKILLASHAHPDHQTADATFKEMSGATTEFMEQDVPALRAMKPPSGKEHPIDHILKDGDTVSLGGTTLTSHLTPGHTLGCTTWTTKITDAGKTYDVVIVCGGLQDGLRLVYNTGYPTIAEDFQKTFDIWAALPCDVFLGAHSWFYDLTGKYAKLKAGPRGVNPYIDNAGYKKYIADSRALWTKIVDEQKAAGPPAPRGGGGRGGQGGA